MILSRNWLTKYLNLEKITNDQISQALNSLGFEVGQEIDYDQLNDQLVIGYVESSTPVPDTHLRFNEVNIGSKKLLEIICGAPNVRAGQYVVVAQVGQTIANGLTLTNRKIRNYQSQGMICALNEIGFTDQVLTAQEADSIYVINDQNQDLKSLIGAPINEVGFGDYLWEIDLTLNRSDALGAFQLVKELANYFDLKITDHHFNQTLKFSKPATNKTLKIHLDPQINKSLQALVYQSIKINQVPTNLNAQEDLLLKTLEVKTTQTVLEDLSLISSWETGQPLIVLDQAKIQEELKLTWATVEGKKLIVLKDGHQIVQVIGLPTAVNYRPTAETEDLLVLSLNFLPSIIRQQQKQLAVSNLALTRYMKPMSPHLYQQAFNALLKWMQSYQMSPKINASIVIKQPEASQTSFEVELGQIQSLLGVDLSISTIKSLFKTLDFTISSKNEKLTFKIDPNRTDIFGVNDLCEEIARLYGYDKIPATPPTLIVNASQQNLKAQLQAKLENYLIGLGFINTKTYSLIKTPTAEHWNLFKLNQPVKLMSPLSQLHETYRLSLAQSLIDTATFNTANGNKQFKLWEIGDVYTQNQRQRHLGLLTTGQLINEPIIHQVLENNYFYLKGILEAIFSLYKIDASKLSFQLQKNPLPEVHPFINAEICYQKKVVGFIFRLNPKFENDQKIAPTCYAEINLDLINELMKSDYSIQSVSRFQSSSRDLSLIVPATLGYEKLTTGLLKGVDKVVDFKLIDQYQDEAMREKDEQSLTISFTFNDLNQQMSEVEINQQWTQILKNVQKLGLVVR